jgi:hypothetical protein
MSTARDELAKIIKSPESFDGGPASCGPNDVYAARTADAILAAGYRAPITPALCLRKAEALSQDGPDYPIVRELIAALKDLVAIADTKDTK